MTRSRSPHGPGIEQLPSGLYRATVSLPLGGRDRFTDESLDRVILWRAQRRLGSDTGQPSRTLDTGKRLTVGEWWTQWLQHSDLDQESTVPMYQSNYRNHIGPGIGNVKLSQVSVPVLNHFYGELRAKGLADSTRARIMGMVSAMLGGAVVEGLIPSNPSAKLSTKRKTIKQGEVRVLERWEFDKLLAESSGMWADLWLIAGHTGLRWAELAGLECRHVDLDRRVIRIAQQGDRAGKVKLSTKDDDARTVGLSDRACEALARHAHRDPHDRVFVGELGAPLRYGNVRRRVWIPTIERLDLADPQPTINSLRHSCFTWAAHAGVAPPDVQAVAGHSSLRTTERYFHSLNGAAARVAAAFDD